MARPGRWFTAALVFLSALNARPARADDDEVLVRGAAGNFTSQATIENSPREITDAASLVEPLPGVHVRRLGADDSFATLSIRGSTSTQVAVYLAGVPLSGGADPTLDLATLPLWPGARATVHRTFAPAALGRGSLGGTLVIDPPSARARSPSTELWAAAGSFGSLRLRMGTVDEVGGVRFATGLSASRSDDDFTYFDGSSRKNVERKNAGHTALAGLESIALPIPLPGTDGALTITLLAQARRQQLPGSVAFTTPLQRLESTRLVQALELSLPAGSGAVNARAWARREGLQLGDDPLANRFGQPYATDDVIVGAGGSVGWKGRPADPLLLEVRLDGSGERFAPGTWLGGASPEGATRTNAGVALDASLLVGPAMIEASGRGDAWVDSSGLVNDTQYRPTGHVGVEVPAGPVVLAAHSGFVARPPSFVERYGNRGAFISAPDLRPESAFTTDAGARLDRRFGPLKLHAEVAGFAQWAEDLITYVYQGVQRFAKATNIGRARIYGIESEVRGGAYGVDLRVAYTGLVTLNDSECHQTRAGCERPPLIGRPAHDFVADVSYTWGPMRVRYGLDYVSGIYFDDRRNIQVPSRMLHGASITTQVARGVSLTFDVRNLFDVRTSNYAGLFGATVKEPIGDLYDYPLPGRRVLLSARFTTGK